MLLIILLKITCFIKIINNFEFRTLSQSKIMASPENRGGATPTKLHEFEPGCRSACMFWGLVSSHGHRAACRGRRQSGRIRDGMNDIRFQLWLLINRILSLSLSLSEHTQAHKNMSQTEQNKTKQSMSPISISSTCTVVLVHSVQSSDTHQT